MPASLLLVLALSSVAATVQGAGAQAPQPSSVTVAVTRPWGPLNRKGIVGVAHVWLPGVATTQPPVQTLLSSDQGHVASARLTLDAIQSPGLPTSVKQATVKVTGDIDPGRYHGEIPLPDGKSLAVVVVVEDAIWWLIIWVALGAASRVAGPPALRWLKRIIWVALGAASRDAGPPALRWLKRIICCPLRAASRFVGPPALQWPERKPPEDRKQSQGRIPGLWHFLIAVATASLATNLLGVYRGHDFGVLPDYTTAFLAGLVAQIAHDVIAPPSSTA